MRALVAVLACSLAVGCSVKSIHTIRHACVDPATGKPHTTLLGTIRWCSETEYKDPPAVANSRIIAADRQAARQHRADQGEPLPSETEPQVSLFQMDCPTDLELVKEVGKTAMAACYEAKRESALAGAFVRMAEQRAQGPNIAEIVREAQGNPPAEAWAMVSASETVAKAEQARTDRFAAGVKGATTAVAAGVTGLVLQTALKEAGDQIATNVSVDGRNSSDDPFSNGGSGEAEGEPVPVEQTKNDGDIVINAGKNNGAVTRPGDDGNVAADKSLSQSGSGLQVSDVGDKNVTQKDLTNPDNRALISDDDSVLGGSDAPSDTFESPQ